MQRPWGTAGHPTRGAEFIIYLIIYGRPPGLGSQVRPRHAAATVCPRNALPWKLPLWPWPRQPTVGPVSPTLPRPLPNQAFPASFAVSVPSSLGCACVPGRPSRLADGSPTARGSHGVPLQWSDPFSQVAKNYCQKVTPPLPGRTSDPARVPCLTPGLVRSPGLAAGMRSPSRSGNRLAVRRCCLPTVFAAFRWFGSADGLLLSATAVRWVHVPAEAAVHSIRSPAHRALALIGG